MSVYYNDNDPKAAAWLRELCRVGAIPNGWIDTRGIADVRPEELESYDQCHFFAGIGGWAYALTLSRWTGPVWTGSCPCQPFSAAGKRLGTADSRHLWPVWARLVAQCRPPTVFGEQVSSSAGRHWLAGVRGDLEGMGYAVGAADLCAAGIGAPHIRQRLYWVADASLSGSARQRTLGGPGGGLGNTDDSGLQGRDGLGRADQLPPRTAGLADPWADCEFIPCRDGKTRRTQRGLFPLAHGIPGRVGLLRGYGNAIVPQLAAEFVQAFIEAKEEVT